MFGVPMLTTVVTGHPMLEIKFCDAKASLSKVIDEVRQGAPSIITRHGRREAVVPSFEERERLSHVPSFGRLLMAVPLEAGDLPDRDVSPLRDANL
jgi:antitoxin Phd